MINWITLFLTIAFVLLLVFRLWRYRDERLLASTWRSLVTTATVDPARFDSRKLDDLPDLVRRFLERSIQNGTPLDTVVEITMHGEFSLGDKQAPNYMPFKACQLLAPPVGFIWEVQAGKGMMQFSGSDAAFPGGSWTRFWLNGILPIARVGGNNDHALSSFGRYMGEAIFWSPASLMPSNTVSWKEIDASTIQLSVTHDKFKQDFNLTVDSEGHLEKVQFQRWSDANSDKIFQLQPFGGFLSDFKKFGGFLLPTTVVAGNHFGTEDYFPFYKATVDSVKFIRNPINERKCRIDK